MDAADALRLHDELLANKPEGARHDGDTCPMCADKAARSTASGSLPASAGPDVTDQSTSTEGGTNPTMSDQISKETHEALLKVAVEEATKATDNALATKTKEASDNAAKVVELEGQVSTLTTDNTRLNSELDAAQVKLTAAETKVTELEKSISDKDAAAQLAEVAAKRSEQVRNLKLFPDEYVAERASRWGALDEAAWDEQVKEWQHIKPAADASATDSTSDSSALSGAGAASGEDKQSDAAAGGAATKSSRRAALGLVG